MMANQNQTRWDFLVFCISFPSSWFLVIINIYSSFDNKKNSSSLSLRTGENFWRGSPPLLFQMSERRCASRPNASDGLPAARVGQSFSSSFYSVFFSPFFLSRKRERGSFQQPDDVAPRCLSLSLWKMQTQKSWPLFDLGAPLWFSSNMEMQKWQHRTMERWRLGRLQQFTHGRHGVNERHRCPALGRALSRGIDPSSKHHLYIALVSSSRENLRRKAFSPAPIDSHSLPDTARHSRKKNIK